MAKSPAQELRARTSENLEHARGAMENYLKFIQKGLSAAPWANTEITKAMTGYAEQNIKHAFDFAQKLTNAEDSSEVMRLQSDFFQRQMKSLADQAKDLADAITKTAANTAKGGPPSA